MSRTKGALYFLLLAVIFLVWNREAYRGYFQTDEIDNVSWTPYVHAIDYLRLPPARSFNRITSAPWVISFSAKVRLSSA